ncbi:hypothetical protein ATX59_07275 [Oenococcus oeni]|uniref:Uncharacterized protein n=1 Tax=Oenococcus oeni TaxID=1247 RepID=A0A6N4A7N6_OENOE|nr:hypothetical protein [Oenococcus oeni]OIM20779.1 hypothetical protein ATX59_07275 [Oenococcus oeni]
MDIYRWTVTKVAIIQFAFDVNDLFKNKNYEDFNYEKNKLSIAAALVASTIAFAPAGAAFADGNTTATTGGSVTFQSGDLTLSNTPSSFDFGTKTVTNSSTSYDSTEDKSGDNIAVDDLRGER